jgi:hypothetical protein
MSDIVRHRRSRERFSRSEPPAAEDPENLENDQTEYGDENTSPQREDGAEPSIPTPNTAQLKLEEIIIKACRDGKRPITRDAGDTPASPRHPESSIISAEIDT